MWKEQITDITLSQIYIHWHVCQNPPEAVRHNKREWHPEKRQVPYTSADNRLSSSQRLNVARQILYGTVALVLPGEGQGGAPGVRTFSNKHVEDHCMAGPNRD